MNKNVLWTGAILSLLSFNAYALSDCAQGEQNCWDCGKTEADLCTARLNTTTKALSITGSGEMRDYNSNYNYSTGIGTTDAPWYGKNFTSVSVEGVKNIGERAFSWANITNADISDSVTNIGAAAFNATKITSITIPDSVTSINRNAFSWNGSLDALFIPESVKDIGVRAFDSTLIHNDNTATTSTKTTVYCADTAPCTTVDADKLITYTKDENGVYKIGNNYYASPDDMLTYTSCGSGNIASQVCIDAATAYQDQKAENMAGGALCATKQDCLELLDMANKKDNCNSIADCAYKINCLKEGRVIYKDKCYDEYPFCKKRWTPAEANEWLNDNNNTVIITFKI